VDRPADDTFDTKGDAVDWLTLKEAEILEDDWIDPDAGNVFVPAYVETWIGESTALRPKTVKIYRGLLRCHIAPYLSSVTVGEMTLARVRRRREPQGTHGPDGAGLRARRADLPSRPRPDVSAPWPMRSAEWRLPPSPRPSRLSQRARNGHVSKISPLIRLPAVSDLGE
jgi:hypothetical protein